MTPSDARRLLEQSGAPPPARLPRPKPTTTNYEHPRHEQGAAGGMAACILQDAARIRQPGGYLRALSRRAAEGGFSPGPMVMALLRREEVRAA